MYACVPGSSAGPKKGEAPRTLERHAHLQPQAPEAKLRWFFFIELACALTGSGRQKANAAAALFLLSQKQSRMFRTQLISKKVIWVDHEE
jgi:hypothetical protein